MPNLISKSLSMPNAACLIAAASLGALAAVFVLQFLFGVDPCELCLWQRGPFAFTAMLALVAIYMPEHAKLLLGICAALFFANAGLALFHSGVERHWWEFHSACTGSALSHTGSVDDLRRELLEKPVTRCDQIGWSLFGLSLANLNVALSALLTIFACAAVRKN